LHFTATTTPALYSLSLHDALPIYAGLRLGSEIPARQFCRDGQMQRGLRVTLRQVTLAGCVGLRRKPAPQVDLVAHGNTEATAIGDRKSTRLNSSHVKISYAVFCLK